MICSCGNSCIVDERAFKKSLSYMDFFGAHSSLSTWKLLQQSFRALLPAPPPLIIVEGRDKRVATKILSLHYGAFTLACILKFCVVYAILLWVDGKKSKCFSTKFPLKYWNSGMRSYYSCIGNQWVQCIILGASYVQRVHNLDSWPTNIT